MTDSLTKILELIAVIGVIYSTFYIGYVLYEDTATEEQYYKARNDINLDLIQSNKTLLEINDIIKVNCERYMETQSDEYYCITKYKSEN